MNDAPESPKTPQNEKEYTAVIREVNDPLRREILEEGQGGKSLVFEHSREDAGAEIEDIERRKELVDTLLAEIRPMLDDFLNGHYPALVRANVKETGLDGESEDPFKATMAQYIDTYRYSNPEAIIEILSKLIGELQEDFDSLYGEESKEKQRWHMGWALTTLKNLFRDYFPDKYEKRYVPPQETYDRRL